MAGIKESNFRACLGNGCTHLSAQYVISVHLHTLRMFIHASSLAHGSQGNYLFILALPFPQAKLAGKRPAICDKCSLTVTAAHLRS